MAHPFKKFIRPEKYVEKIPLKYIVASRKIYRKGVDKYKEAILDGKKIRPIIILKHPKKKLYAVIDGHHRFHAFLELGIKVVDAAVIKSNKFLFNITKNGMLQPTPRMTKYIHIPALIFSRYINKFVRTPSKFIRRPKTLHKNKK